jgi:hypothetical protein
MTCRKAFPTLGRLRQKWTRNIRAYPTLKRLGMQYGSKHGRILRRNGYNCGTVSRRRM